MKANEVREKYLKFFEKRGHKIISPAPLVLANDPTTLFTSSGMQPLVPYLMGEPHPEGERVVDSQPSLRVQDIEEVGDNRHTTFFEMLGNWSFGNYFKEEQLKWIFEFLTDKKEGIGLDPLKLYVTVFGGEDGFSVNGRLNQLTPDFESMKAWQELFESKHIIAEVANTSSKDKPDIKKGRIFYYGVEKNWWSRSGTPTQMPIDEIGGPDSEIFYDFGEDLRLHEDSQWKNEPCHPNCDCGRFLEIGNSVFIQYKKTHKTGFEELPNKNVDFGGGLERLTAATLDNPDIFEIDLFKEMIQNIGQEFNISYYESQETTRRMRIIVDHMRASAMLIAEGVLPSNKGQGYVLRKLIRRAVFETSRLKHNVINQAKLPFFRWDLRESNLKIKSWVEVNKVFEEEKEKFSKSLIKGQKEFEKFDESQLNGLNAFDLYQTYGFPLEVIRELYLKKGIKPEKWESDFKEAQRIHSQLSRTASAGMFKGGLADHSEETTRLHTATHLLHEALRKVLGEHVSQKGSNITHERLRFDFTHTEKLTDDQKSQVEEMVNEQIKKDLPVSFEMMTLEEAKKKKALAFFGERYGEKVKVYSIGDFSKEVCGGPHVEHLAQIGGHVTIFKEESAGAGIRRLYAKIV